MSTTAAARLVEDHTLIAERYQTERLLGRGGMGAVYAAFDPVTKRRVALKLLSPASNEKAVALFEREYQTLASLKHPHIVEVFEYGRSTLGAYYTMELLEGSDLSARAPMAWREVCACLRDVASILGVLHVRGLVHRDLSPRNLWRSLDGRLKLIDFGALAPFGVPNEIMGTPPFVPPEALNGLALDQRSDLFALGALGYWLLTSVQAYPAKSLGELPALWAREPARPSSLVALLGSQLEPLPKALEEVLYALLRLEPGQRLGSTAELIDRLNAIAEMPPESIDGTAQGYLQSKAFVGRERERDRLLHHLAEAEGGKVQALLIEGAAGLGRSRLLEEMAIVTRVAGATTVTLDARLATQPYGLAATLVERLIGMLPEALSAAKARAELFSQLSPALRVALGGKTSASLVPQGEARLLLQTALQSFLLEVARTRLLALFVDDLQGVDEQSLAVLSVVARADAGHRLLLVASVLREGSSELSPMVTSLRNVAVRFRLLPLTRAETQEMLRSVFSDAPYLERLAERFHRISGGNPRHCLELSQHLVRIGAARYADGLWTLPTDLANTQLPKSREEGFLARLSQLSPAARKLAAQLSIPHDGPLPGAVCLALVPEAASLLSELSQVGVLLESGAGYAFAHDSLRDALARELGENERATAHLRFADSLLQGATDRGVLLAAGLHYLQGGDITRGEQLQRRAACAVTDAVDLDLLRRDAPLLEQGFELLKSHGRDQYALAPHLTALAVSAYYADRKYVRYGELAITTLSGILRLELARKLRGVLGAKLALIVALLVASVAIALRRSRALNLSDTIRYLFTAAGALAGTAAMCVDAKAARGYAAAIEPMSALGPDHAAGFIYRFTKFLGERSEDHLARTMRDGRALVARLVDPTPIRNMPESIRENFLAGGLVSLGLAASWRDGPECLQIAERLDAYSPFFKMAADQLRAGYHASQGNAAEAMRYRQRVETHAIQLGSAWQVETWAPSDTLKASLATHDALGLKRAAQELARLGEELPSFSQHARSARAAYSLVRGKPAEVLPLLDRDDEPQAVLGWARVRGLLARAYNALGRHARAREICRDVLTRIDPEDMTFPAMNLGVAVELALAEAGLGNFAVARASLTRLLEEHGPNRGPLTMASLHDAYFQLALMEKDFDTCAEQLEQLRAWVQPTAIVSLLERVDLLKRELLRARRNGDGSEVEVGLLDGDDAHLITRVQLILTQTGTQVAERANKGLQIAVELSAADDGFIVLQGALVEAAACLNTTPSAELVAWAHQRLMAAYASDETAAVEQVESLIDLNLNVVNGVRYCVAPLWARRDNQDVVVAALALGFRKTPPRLPGADVLRVIADHLINAAAPSGRPTQPITG